MTEKAGLLCTNQLPGTRKEFDRPGEEFFHQDGLWGISVEFSVKSV